MTDTSKINKIENLKDNEFSFLIGNLISKMGYSVLSSTNQAVIGELPSPLFKAKHLFILTDKHLTGEENSNDVLELINSEQSKGGYTATFLVSKYHISKGFKAKLEKDTRVQFFDRDEIISQIDKLQNDYWKHEDISLLDYEKAYKNQLQNESELKSLKIFNEKYQSMLNIFVEPKIVYFYEDFESKIPMKKNISIDSIVKDRKPVVISGEAGMGKSTLLKRIGELIIESNQADSKKNLPLFISVTELYENNYELTPLINSKIKPFFSEELDTLYKSYDFTLLIDSIDEFEIVHQKKIVKQLNNLHYTYGVRFILSTRNSEKSLSVEDLKDWKSYSLSRFTNKQMEQFISKFFVSQKDRAEKLLEALRENRIIDKLPITPLSLSLISILYEENDLEIPATITDIYENFNSLLLGKPLVSDKIEFIDISFKERILSLYALKLLDRPEHTPMTIQEFHNYFIEYYSNKSTPLKKGSIEDALNYLIHNTGIIYLKNNTYICFNHDSFMEYYASVEIFKHQRTDEQKYVQNFFDINWQNSAVFYAGHSKDMPGFLKEINTKISNTNNLNDFFSSVSGAGYILQALYQTDNTLRKETVSIALENNLKSLDLFFKLASDDKMLFKNFKLPLIWLMNMLFFHENFNSGTLKQPLKLMFDNLFEKYKANSSDTTLGYSTLIVALTLASNRVDDRESLNELIFNSPLLDDNILSIVTELSLGIFTTGHLKELKSDLKKEFSKNKSKVKHLLEVPASKLRFSAYDKIQSNKKVKIITEGKTDASIIEHAFMTLTKGEVPYWSIKPSGNDSGNAKQVNQALLNAKCTLTDEEIIIGIFDHDFEGIKEFNMLNTNIFISQSENKLVKKHKDSNVYAVLLPIPGNKSFYKVSEQINNYFEIEHYLTHSFLEENGALEKTLLSDSHGIYSIKDSKKKEVTKKVVESTNPEIFTDFIHLFEIIDKISDIHISYE